MTGGLSMDKKEYFIGLDCGTDSVGFAVTDTEYNLLKFNGKTMWGSHLFDAAQTAEQRRTARTARRRLKREKQRIEWVQEMFADAVSEIDPVFFIRLNDSFYKLEDKTTGQRNILFDDNEFKDKDFFKRFPTIYHLRFALMHSNDPSDFDPRYVYLAVAHIMRHRGHFLFPGENLNAVNSIKEPLRTLEHLLNDVLEVDSELSAESSVIEAALLSNRNKEKREKLNDCIVIGDKNVKDCIVKMLCGYSARLDKLFSNEQYKDLPAIEFSKRSFEESDLPQIENGVSDDEFEIIRMVKSIYDWSLLSVILDGCTSVSESKCRLYDRNHEELSTLKRAIKKFAPNSYHSFFHGTSKNDAGNYVFYTGKDHDLKLKRQNKNVRVSKCSTEDFYKAIRKVLSSASLDDPDVEYIFNAIENKTFMPLLQSYRNGVIPNQIIKAELEQILTNSAKYLPLLNKTDESGLSVKEKLLQLVSFRIDYFVGPLGSNSNSRNIWAVRLEQGRITPWNFSQKIDLAASAEQFILRMTNKCTYLRDQDVLPKNSLLYSAYQVLNDLNNVRINGDFLTIDQKQIIFDELFMARKTVTQKALKTFAVKKGWYSKNDELEIKGIDGDFKSSLKPFIDFAPYLESGKLARKDAEEIIKLLTIFSEGGKILEEKLKLLYGDKLSSSDIREIMRLKYTGWGRLSAKFLNGIAAPDPDNGEYKTIIQMLWTSQYNLMELLSKKFDYYDQTVSREAIGDLSYDVLDDLYVSPSVKRQIWQTLRIVDEIVRVMKSKPKKVFLEVARGSDENQKGRTKTRKESLLEAMKKGRLNDEDKAIIAELNETEDSLISKRDKLYLYYSQMGKCMYSGRPIDIDDLDNVNVYDIDHIYPFSKSNDDSLTNKVLVCSALNREKTNSYPISDSVRSKMAGFWKMLHEKGLINDEKYHRLTRATPFSEDEFENFVARQLVETRQSTKAAAGILRRFFGEETKIVYSKAGAVSAFRQKFGFAKCRSVNDLHHAKDAYLNIVAGNILDTKYTSAFCRSADFGNEYYNLSKPFDYNVVGAWIIDKGQSLKTVHSMMAKNNILLTRQPVMKSGALFDLMLVKAGGGGLVPSKMDPRLRAKLAESDKGYNEELAAWTDKYGGYNKAATSHFAVVRYTEKKKSYVEFVQIRIVDRSKLDSADKIKAYCEQNLGYEDVHVLRTKVLINTVIEVNGFRMWLSGKSNDKLLLKTCTPLILDEGSVRYVKHIEKYNERLLKDKNYILNEKYDMLSREGNMRLYDVLAAKACANIFSRRPGNKAEAFAAGREKFSALSVQNQVKVLSNMLKYFNGNGCCDLSDLGDKPSAGTLTSGSRTECGKKKISIIDQSITGLFESENSLT